MFVMLPPGFRGKRAKGWKERHPLAKSHQQEPHPQGLLDLAGQPRVSSDRF